MFEWFRVERSPKTVSGDNRAEGARHTFLKRDDGKTGNAKLGVSPREGGGVALQEGRAEKRREATGMENGTCEGAPTRVTPLLT